MNKPEYILPFYHTQTVVNPYTYKKDFKKYIDLFTLGMSFTKGANLHMVVNDIHSFADIKDIFTIINEILDEDYSIYIDFLRSDYVYIDYSIFNDADKVDELNTYFDIMEEMFFYNYDTDKFEKFSPDFLCTYHFKISTVFFDFIQKYKKLKISNKFLCDFSFVKATLVDGNQFVYLRNDIYSLYPLIEKWKNLYQTITQEYDMLKPFDIELEESISGTANLNDDDYTSDSTEKIYAFNSSNSGDGVPTSKTGETTHRSTNSDRDESRNYTRKGNIGNKSQAQLIMEERQKAMFNLKEIIFEDIASVLCRKTYTK